MGCSKSSSKREVYSNTILPQETKKHQIDNLTAPKTTGKRRTKKKPIKKHKQRLNNTFLNNQQVTEEIKRKIKKILETNDNENTTTQKPMRCSKSSSKREVYSNTILPQETRKKSNK